MANASGWSPSPTDVHATSLVALVLPATGNRQPATNSYGRGLVVFCDGCGDEELAGFEACSIVCSLWAGSST